MVGDEAVSGAPELRESYEACAAETRRFLAPMWKATELLPAAIRPHVHAVHGFMMRTDRVADEGGARTDREKRIVRWRSDTLAELRAGHSEHPLRRAFVDTVLRWDLDRAVLEEFLDTILADCVSPPVFETFADQRRYLRGATGTIFEMWTPLLDVRGAEVSSLTSVLGEVCQLVDIIEDLPADLAAGRCYLPRADLRRLGLEIGDLRRGERREALDELVGLQLDRWTGLLERAVPVTGMVGPEYQPFLHTLLLGAQLQFDETVLRQARVFTDGIDPLTSIGPARRRPARPHTGAVPDHVAVIMDGNRRWAAQRGMSASQGHHAGERAAMRLVNAALRLGIRHLSIYVFSTENWRRSQDELVSLFDALADRVVRGIEWLHEMGVQVRWCGRRDRIEPSLASELALAESMTSNNDVLSLTVCVDYGGREELTEAARALAAEAVAGTIRPEDIRPEDLARNLYAPGLPDVDLLIRTSGEQRISNFLPWHLAYAELVFDRTLWPDFGLARLRDAVTAYAGRRRRFGGGLPGPARPVEPAPTS
ncbi:di-trans,poly-cis-decaprenylcistransferase [Streptomyces sp. TRM43335]|uniref:Isoprenyl transferase n=1 Tax=Streptomyces taklimakanensis TaxID=2569853 RepID=A0A6G2BJE6_9ACTN|nr:polyprenyl diphosphate synthase [Streptomyces taklimakanensis]MTE22407.1 di-trans,poly-cis-decaprenylcistransferase [Streptomyces taklimakanensis]